jgi:Putative auto-transporter adhesin, head GIN domain
MTIVSAPRRGRRTPHRNQVALVPVFILAIIGVILLVHDVILGSSSTAGVQGSGVAATQTRALPRFSSLDLADSNIVTVVVGAQQSVVIHADNNLLRYVTTRVVAGNLVIGTTGSFTTRSPMSVEVRVPSLAALNLSGSGIISVSGIKVPRLAVTISGSGVLRASGTATRLDVTLGGAGQAELGYLVARDVHAAVTGSGLIRVTATSSLNAAVPGTGAIIYGGNPPHVTSRVTGTGAVTRG